MRNAALSGAGRLAAALFSLARSTRSTPEKPGFAGRLTVLKIDINVARD